MESESYTKKKIDKREKFKGKIQISKETKW
jgi:hypothetical protein